MLPLHDAHWAGLEGGYRLPYDPRPALARLRAGDHEAWEELWTELHHQGDVGAASYAAVPHLVDIHRQHDLAEWQTYALMGAIELCRKSDRNPGLPDWLKDIYEAAWRGIVPTACRDLGRSDQDEL